MFIYAASVAVACIAYGVWLAVDPDEASSFGGLFVVAVWLWPLFLPMVALIYAGRVITKKFMERCDGKKRT